MRHRHRPAPHRRDVLLAALAGPAALAALPAQGAPATTLPFDRAVYERYIGFMNAGDPRFADFYAEDVRFIMDIRGKAAVIRFFEKHRPFVRESVDILFFCSDRTGAASEVRSTLRCVKDCADLSVFDRALRAGEVQRTHGYLFYVLDKAGKIAAIKGPPPTIEQPWHMETP